MKVSTEIDNNFGYEKITQLVDNIPLSYIVFFYNCNFFCFRALDEHKQLDASQFSISVDTNGNKELHYTGRLCKNVQGV